MVPLGYAVAWCIRTWYFVRHMSLTSVRFLFLSALSYLLIISVYCGHTQC